MQPNCRHVLSIGADDRNVDETNCRLFTGANRHPDLNALWGPCGRKNVLVGNQENVTLISFHGAEQKEAGTDRSLGVWRALDLKSDQHGAA